MKDIKVFIDDAVARHSGGEEQELAQGTRIRFEIGNTHLTCKATQEGIEIYKINDMGAEESRIMTMGSSSNVLFVF